MASPAPNLDRDTALRLALRWLADRLDDIPYPDVDSLTAVADPGQVTGPVLAAAQNEAPRLVAVLREVLRRLNPDHTTDTPEEIS